MPANLTPQYYKLEKEFKAERDPFEKLRLARELLAIMPKHKGTDKLQAELKAKISKLKDQVEGGGATHGAHRVDPFSHIDQEGAGQIILIGAPNAGKSSIVDAVTHAHPEIADYPFTTREPHAGMAEWETIQLQLIDTPPVSAEHMEHYIPNLVRQADLVLLVLDVSSPDWATHLLEIRERLEARRVILSDHEPDEVEDTSVMYKRTIVAAHKYLDEGGAQGLADVQNTMPDYTIVPTSVLDDSSMTSLLSTFFGALNIMRVYTKRAGQPAEFRNPVILPAGATVEDAARGIHKDFAQKLQFARVWGHSKIEGQRVKNTFVLTDRDVIEFHM